MKFSAFLTVVTLLLAGCSTNQVSVGYQPSSAIVAYRGQPLVQVGEFVDGRKVDPRWLGAVRGGFGQPLKVLETATPVSDVVKKAFSDGLAARGMLQTGAGSRFVLTATIEKFDCSQYVRRQAHASVTVTLRETSSGRTVSTEAVQREVIRDSNPFDVGVFASTDDLLAVAIEALRAAVDAALDSPKMRQALSSS